MEATQREPRWKKEPKQALVKIPKGATEFYAPNGDKWFRIIAPEELSLERFEVFEERLYEYTFLKSWQDILQDTNKIWDMAATGDKHADIRTIAFNMMWSMKNVHLRKKFAARLCSVFTISEDDSESEFDPSAAEKNIKVWNKNFENDFFLDLAANTVGGYNDFATLILKIYLGKEVMELYMEQREQILHRILNLEPQAEASTTTAESGLKFTT